MLIQFIFAMQMKLAYREYGSGKPLIILHGLFGQSDNWNTIAKKFAAQNLRVFTVDQRNHGLSPHSDIWDYEAMANDLHEFILKHNLKNPVLLGHSMGGKTVMFHEMLHPGIASKIIIADIAPRAYESRHDEVLKALNCVKFDSITTRKQAEEILNIHIEDFGTKQFLLKNIYWKNAETGLMDWRFNLKVISEEYDKVGVEIPYGHSNVPSLFIKGGNSHYISDTDEADIKSRFPNAEIKTIPGAGHWVHAEKPNEFFEIVMGFIQEK